MSFLDDEPYREKAIELCFAPALEKRPLLSMVDCQIRLNLDDVNVKIGYLATFNNDDFIDVCLKRRIGFI